MTSKTRIKLMMDMSTSDKATIDKNSSIIIPKTILKNDIRQPNPSVSSNDVLINLF